MKWCARDKSFWQIYDSIITMKEVKWNSFDKNLFLDRCYSVIQQMISNCKKTKTHEMGVTFVKDMPDYIPADEKNITKKP